MTSCHDADEKPSDTQLVTDREATFQAQGRFAVNVGSKAKRHNQADAEEHGVTDDKAPEDRKCSDGPRVPTGLHPEGSVEGVVVVGRVVGRVHHGGKDGDVAVALLMMTVKFFVSEYDCLRTVQFPEL